MAKSPKTLKTAKAPKAPVTPIRPAAAPKPPVMPVMTEEEIVARNAMRAAANIKGARLVTGDFIIGKRVNGGLQDVFTIILQPVPMPDGGTNMRINFVPFTPPFFIRDESRPDVGDRHMMDMYEVPDEIAFHYMDRLKQTNTAKLVAEPGTEG